MNVRRGISDKRVGFMAVLLRSARESISPAERAAVEGRTQRRRPDVSGRRRGRLPGARLGGHGGSTRGLPPVRPGGHLALELDLIKARGWGSCLWLGGLPLR